MDIDLDLLLTQIREKQSRFHAGLMEAIYYVETRGGFVHVREDDLQLFYDFHLDGVDAEVFRPPGEDYLEFTIKKKTD